MKNMIAHFQLRLLIFIRRWTPVTLTLADNMLLMSIFLFIYLLFDANLADMMSLLSLCFVYFLMYMYKYT